MTDLKLIALDAEDLEVLSAHVQDAVIQVGDMAYLPRERRFVAVANRFDWAEALAASNQRALVRRRSGLRFERVLSAKVHNIDLSAKRQVVSLLTIQYAQTAPDDPAGEITLTFAGGAAIRLGVECVEAELKDLGAAWRTRRKPKHPG